MSSYHWEGTQDHEPHINITSFPIQKENVTVSSSMQCTIDVTSVCWLRQILAKISNSPNTIARQNLLIYSIWQAISLTGNKYNWFSQHLFTFWSLVHWHDSILQAHTSCLLTIRSPFNAILNPQDANLSWILFVSEVWLLAHDERQSRDYFYIVLFIDLFI